MPIFEFQCPVDSYRFERLLTHLPEGEVSDCPDCGARSPFVWSRVTMKPDPYWSGVMTENYGYVTSGSQVAKIQKQERLVEIGDRNDLEAMSKRADDAARAKKEKFSQQTRKFLEESFSGAGVLDSFGQVRPEAMEKLSDESILDPEGQKQKQEPITISH